MLLDLAHRLRRIVFRATGWRTRGVRVMVFDREGRLLLIRHGYGAREVWMMPGGGLRRGETPEAGARREVREEVGCLLEGLEPVGVYASVAEGWRDTVHLFRAISADRPEVDRWEVVEARWFALDALPAGVSASTRRRIAELNGAPRSPDW